MPTTRSRRRWPPGASPTPTPSSSATSSTTASAGSPLGLDDAFFRAFDERIDELWTAQARRPGRARQVGRPGVVPRPRRRQPAHRLPHRRPPLALGRGPPPLPRRPPLHRRRAHLRPARGRHAVALLPVRLRAVAAPRPDVRRDRPAEPPDGVVDRPRGHHPRQRPAALRPRLPPHAVVRVRGRHRVGRRRRGRGRSGPCGAPTGPA